MKRAFVLAAMCIALFLSYVLVACQREDGLPDPPPRLLVPCVPDAAADDPLACPAPAPVDAGEDQLSSSD